MKKNKRIFFLSLAVSILVLVGTTYLVNRKRHGFYLDKITSTFEPSPKWAISNFSEIEKEDLCKILFQDYNYLGIGIECFAFLSADGKYVLKFFKMRHLLPKNWLKFFPLPGLEDYRFRKIDQRILRHQELFSSYKMAFDELKEDSGLIYIHLNKSKDLQMKIRIYDRMRRCYRLNLDDYEFIVQKKAQLVNERITALMQKGDREGALRAMHALLKQVVRQCKKGFIDRDSGVSNNYGFVGDRVIHFDLGRMVRDETAQNPAYYQREILRVGQKLEIWLKLNYPELLPELDEIINEMMAEPN